MKRRFRLYVVLVCTFVGLISLFVSFTYSFGSQELSLENGILSVTHKSSVREDCVSEWLMIPIVYLATLLPPVFILGSSKNST